MDNFADRLCSFLQLAQTKIDEHYKTNFPALTPDNLTVHEGKKFVKVVKGGSVYCFINKQTGDVLKAASWNAPAKHARGNIFNDDFGMNGITVWGGTYLR